MSIEINNVSYTYAKGLPHESKAVTDVSLKISKGTFLGIVGHTGSGKSTLLQLLNGLLKPDCGNIFINEANITDSKTTAVEMRKKTGLVFQYPEYQLFEETVEKDIAFGPKNLGLPEEEILDRIKMALDLVGLSYEEYKDKSPFELSGGQRRRVAIAGVLAMKPEVLILDEPTAGLDPKTHEDILEMINETHKIWNGITILVSHSMDDIAKCCDKVLVMDEGRIVLDGAPREVFSKEDMLNKIGLTTPKATRLYNKLKKENLIGKTSEDKEENCTNNIPITTDELVRILEGIL